MQQDLDHGHGHIPPDVRMDSNIPNEEHEPSGGEGMSFDISKYLEDVDYPAAKEDIIDYAVDLGAETVVIEMLEQLPDTTYNSPTDVSQALDESTNEVT